MYYERDREQRIEYSRSYYAENKEKCLDAMREYHAANAAERNAYRREYVAKNRDAVLEDSRKRHFENREENLAKSRQTYWANREHWIRKACEWSKNNLDKKRVYGNRRRAQLSSGVLSTNIVKKLKIAQHEKCLGCGEPLGEKFHLDHFVPLSKGGSNSDDNVQLLHPTCNIRKNDLMPDEWFKRFGITPYLPPFAACSKGVVEQATETNSEDTIPNA